MTESHTPTPPSPDIDRKIFDKVMIESTNAKIGLNPEGGYITSWRVRNPQTGAFEEILYQGGELKRTGIPTLFPNYGEGDVTHGFWRGSTCEIVAASPSKAVMTLDQNRITPEMRGMYPYPFRTEVTVEAQDNGSMVYSMRIINNGDRDMPITPGLHPYWAIPHQDKDRIQTEGIVGFEAGSIDWDTNPPDTAYDFNGRILLRFPARDITIEDESENGSVVKYIVAWSQTPQKPDFNFVCFEPITGGDNAIKTNPILVPAKGEWNMRLIFSSKPNTSDL